MNTKIVMIVCSAILGFWGMVLTFLPQESATALGWADTNPILLQLMGALYFSFAMVNWTAKANLIGGIYGKPIALGNFTHFMIGALALIKQAISNPSAIIWIIITILYSVFALVFGYIAFTHPTVKAKEKTILNIL